MFCVRFVSLLESAFVFFGVEEKNTYGCNLSSKNVCIEPGPSRVKGSIDSAAAEWAQAGRDLRSFASPN